MLALELAGDWVIWPEVNDQSDEILQIVQSYALYTNNSQQNTNSE